jgi:hypothetical protein
MSYETYEVRIYPNGSKYWFQNGKRHRLDGPACEYYDGSKDWYQNGKHHRLDGPAVEYSDGSKEWWINGTKYSEDEFNLFIKKENKIKELKTSCDGKFVEVDGVKYRLTKV